ncbi:zinc protease [Parabacteroides sp. PFB2-12]|uniref:M16 family metallopeptidase n=1 Tax=unclassified Parabacteroides TaxID=2649774 RepID=UPI002475ADF3|nr:MULTISPECIES: pitrilysin family protein [unclassified Parabacteroides]MDH6343706.1 zinc protease [Parabacteroides sp. PM6-13]MDH6391342.1 zinc protease [Parabacteroides sp. PFB2-12]
MKKIIYSLLFVLICSIGVKAQTLDRSIRPEAAPAKEVNIKDAQIFTLKNGLKVFLVEDKNTPLVYYSLQLDVKQQLQGEKAGMNGLFSDVFGTATKNRTKEQLNKDIDMIAMRGGVHRGGGYGYFLKKYHDQALDIMTDMLFNPVFSQEEFDLNIGKYKTALNTLGDDAGQITSRIANALIYGKGYPAGEVETLETLDNITLADLEGYYNTYFAPNVARLVIVGDISLKEAKKQAEKYFGKWAKKNVPVAEYTIPTAPEQLKVAFANKPGAVQSAIDVCYPIQFNVKEADYDAAAVMSQILGGSGTGHLFMNLREDKSWTYGIYTSLSSGEQVGSMSLTSGRGAASVKAAATDSAIHEVLYEFNRIINEPVTEQELKDAVTYRAGNFSRSLADSETMAQFAVNIDKYNLSKDYYRNYLKRLEALTPADIQAAAKKYIKPENAWIVVTGDKQYADALARFAGDGKVQWYDYDVNPIEAPKAEVANVSAEEIIANYVKALGGQEAIDKVNDYKIVGEMEMMGQTGVVEQYFKKPNMSVTSMSIQGMVIQKMAFDGKTLRVSGMQGSQELTEGKEYDAIKNGTGLAPEMSYLQNGYTLTVGAVEEVNGEKAYTLKVERDGNATTEYYSVASGLKLRSVQTVQSPMGEMQTISDIGDYREVNGVKFPHEMTQSVMGQAMKTVFKTVEVNTGLQDSVFK